ncbi:MAG: hypothetical protein K9H49_03205 [Bacteroidales bacterium]|nr:hypothetical protein [Bacteroidales bacterium]MCF8389628.1 hypothetical protein [Bacteroidales bacterium]
MKQFRYISLIGFAFIFILTACNKKSGDKSQEQSFNINSDAQPVNDLREIYYNMYLPDEMSRLFERVGANFYPDILNPSDDFSRYTNEKDIAAIIGVYGVDLSYAQLYEQNLLTAKYLTTIQYLTPKIGIPENYFTDLFENLENSISIPDSIEKISSELYLRTDQFLKESGDNSVAALIVMGGWVEALYIACKILEYNSNNIEILDRIAEQKYSLNSLLSLMNNYQDDIRIAEDVLMLKRLKRSFDQFDIYYDIEGFELDTINKSFSTSGYNSGLTPEIASEINRIITEIRTELVR